MSNDIIATASAYIDGGRTPELARALGAACGWDRDLIDSALYEAYDPAGPGGYWDVVAFEP